MAASGPSYLDFEQPIHEIEQKIEELETFADSTQLDLGDQIAQLRLLRDDLRRDIQSRLTPWQRVQIARHPGRPVAADYLEGAFTDFVELHGDRTFGDDGAIATGFAKLGERRVLVVAHRKGKTTKDRIACNFGSAHPEGYRKAILKMQLAEKYGLPVITLIDTPGAFPGVGAEERGQAFIIARNLLEMAKLTVPVICTVIGEGGSGGALGIGIGDRMLMLQNAYYSVISPEGCSSILWKTAEKASEAAAILKLTAKDLKRFRIVDEIVPEPVGGAHTDPATAVDTVREALIRTLDELEALETEQRLEMRYAKLRSIGVFLEDGVLEARRVEVGSTAD